MTDDTLGASATGKNCISYLKGEFGYQIVNMNEDENRDFGGIWACLESESSLFLMTLEENAPC
jgi:hypothetical protein